MTLWLLRGLPGRDATGYVAAQLAGSLAGVMLGRAVLGAVIADPAVNYAAIGPAAGWSSGAVFAERFTYLWAYLLGPLAGAVILVLLVKALGLPQPLTCSLCGIPPRDAARKPIMRSAGDQDADHPRMPGGPAGAGIPWHTGR
ncbi:MAG: hypothetical protein ACM3ML_09465 [Micromonosporaceae bacterium]